MEVFQKIKSFSLYYCGKEMCVQSSKVVDLISGKTGHSSVPLFRGPLRHSLKLSIWPSRYPVPLVH